MKLIKISFSSFLYISHDDLRKSTQISDVANMTHISIIAGISDGGC